MVLAAGRTSSPGSRQALTTLCETYWYPAYAYVRKRGSRREEAQDLTQEFFVRLLEKDVLRSADPERGRFRSFLLGSLKNFLTNEWRDARAKKRGGSRVHLSLDFESAEDQYSLEPTHELTPERIYERRWALTLLEQSLSKLRQDFTRSGKSDLFDRLKVFLGGEGQKVSYRDVAEKFAMTEGAVKVSVHRLRRRCRELLREEIAQTVAGPEEVDEELRFLFSALDE
ncbi:MAG: sigma-70 family RNA polymerase sigma factor [Planctomycetota bacterium]|nr:sigma-70 family RNA polymerase sigma factor [Planctomycetota bacterium]